MGDMGAGHFIYIPAMIIVGVVIGWILGSRAARDALAVEVKKREEHEARKAARAARPADARPPHA